VLCSPSSPQQSPSPQELMLSVYIQMAELIGRHVLFWQFWVVGEIQEPKILDALSYQAKQKTLN